MMFACVLQKENEFLCVTRLYAGLSMYGVYIVPSGQVNNPRPTTFQPPISKSREPTGGPEIVR